MPAQTSKTFHLLIVWQPFSSVTVSLNVPEQPGNKVDEKKYLHEKKYADRYGNRFNMIIKHYG
jgi:hypothetical protein